MRDTGQGTSHERVPRYLRLAFYHARLGEESVARSYMESAVQWGFRNPKVAQQFEDAIKEAKPQSENAAPPLRRRKQAES